MNKLTSQIAALFGRSEGRSPIRINLSISSLILLFIASSLRAQDVPTLQLSLTDVVEIAREETSDSLKQRIAMQFQVADARIAQVRLQNSFWNYQSYLSNYKPQMNLRATLPNFSRSIDGITQPDGTIQFQSFNNMTNSVGATLTQPIARTGGTVFASTRFQRIDVFQASGNTVSYFSNPISIGFDQPFFAFNDLKWDKIIEPMIYNEAKRKYGEDLERIALEAVGLFFDIYIAQISLEAAIKDKANADTLYIISQGRYNVGKIAETELLQIEISKLNADASLAAATLNLQTSTEELRNFLGIKQSVQFELSLPTNIPDLVIDPQLALSYARANGSKVIEFERRLKEAERNLAQAERNNGFNASINGQFGLSQTDATLVGSFSPLLDQERITLEVTVPIMDWGRAEARREIARSNQEIVRMSVEQDQINFEREVLLKVQQFDLIRSQARLAQKNFEVAQKTYDLTRKRYLIGKIGVIDLNLALADQDRSRRAYMNALQSFWKAYYEIRRLTLYDFINNQPLQGAKNN